MRHQVPLAVEEPRLRLLVAAAVALHGDGLEPDGRDRLPEIRESDRVEAPVPPREAQTHAKGRDARSLEGHDPQVARDRTRLVEAPDRPPRAARPRPPPRRSLRGPAPCRAPAVPPRVPHARAPPGTPPPRGRCRPWSGRRGTSRGASGARRSRCPLGHARPGSAAPHLARREIGVVGRRDAVRSADGAQCVAAIALGRPALERRDERRARGRGGRRSRRGRGRRAAAVRPAGGRGARRASPGPRCASRP